MTFFLICSRCKEDFLIVFVGALMMISGCFTEFFESRGAGGTATPLNGLPQLLQ